MSVVLAFSLVLIPIALRLLYLLLTKGPSRTPVQFFNKQSERFAAVRRKAFLPPYPNGWWKICDVSDLNNGRIQTAVVGGQEVVAFRSGNDGPIGVLDAFCPHIGAHLGMGGTVMPSGTLQCPFHGWEFDTEGKCQKIPYCTSEKLPDLAKTKAWKHCIWLDMVFVWFDAEGREPAYELRPQPQLEGNEWELRSALQIRFDMHVAEMAENSADYFHFNFLHAALPIPVIGRFFTIKHETKLYFPEEANSTHLSYFDNFATVWFLNKICLKFTLQKTVVTFEGPSIVHFQINTPLGGLHLVKTLLPTAPFKLHSEDKWYAEKKTPRWLSRIVAIIAAGALEQDRTVWENKTFRPQPKLVAGDGPFPAHRRWFKQFYSEHSADVGKDSLEW